MSESESRRGVAAVPSPLPDRCAVLPDWSGAETGPALGTGRSRFRGGVADWVGPCPGGAPVPAGSAGCRGRNRGCPLKECLRGPARERYGVVPRQAGDIDEPDDGFNADGGADAEHELAELLVGEVSTDAVERLGDPCDRTALTEGERVSFGGVRLEGQAQHRSLLRLGVQDHGAEVADDGIESRRRVLWRVYRKHRCGGDLGVRRQEQRALVREVAVRGGP